MTIKDCKQATLKALYQLDRDLGQYTVAYKFFDEIDALNLSDGEYHYLVSTWIMLIRDASMNMYRGKLITELIEFKLRNPGENR